MFHFYAPLRIHEGVNDVESRIWNISFVSYAVVEYFYYTFSLFFLYLAFCDFWTVTCCVGYKYFRSG